MMHDSIFILDVSLRDGGYRTNFHFNEDDLAFLLTALDSAGIDYIEIGYRNGPLLSNDAIGVAGLCDADYVRFCKKKTMHAKIAVMIHPQNVSVDDLHELYECGVSLVRICVSKQSIDAAEFALFEAKKIGLETSVNLTYLSGYSHSEMDRTLNRLIQYQPNLVYFADTNGNLLPAYVRELFNRYTQRYKQPLGFHAHDNLGLAAANSLAAIEAGARFIDCSLCGMGKGIGNLRMELFTAYLQAMQCRKYKLQPIVLAANYARKQLKIGIEPIDTGDLIRSLLDLSTTELLEMKQRGLSWSKMLG